jgi:hypothetical protein
VKRFENIAVSGVDTLEKWRAVVYILEGEVDDEITSGAQLSEIIENQSTFYGGNIPVATVFDCGSQYQAYYYWHYSGAPFKKCELMSFEEFVEWAKEEV